MFKLYLKEIKDFLNSLIGIIVVAVFLTVNALFLFVFPGQFNILETGYADLSPLFILAPWMFMFLVPAITMRSFSEEERTGTIELLLTKPITEWQIVVAKFSAGVTLVFFSLLPTLLYYYTVYQLGSPQGNLDVGATWGSYLGLLFLACSFVAIGIFSSSLTNNQIIAFITAVFFSFFIYIGFEQIANFSDFGTLDSYLINLGINEHYISMSRGVIDTRDLIYFLSLSFLFLIMSQLKLESRKW